MDEMILPRSWQDWHITEEIGEGAYGRVYRAEKENGGVTAVSAIKVIRIPSERSEYLSLRREFQSDEELRRNLKEMVDGYANEIRAMYRLQGHTHIVSIQDHLVEEAEDGPGWRIYIRMEYLQPFNDYAMTHTFSREEIIRLGISLCEALGACAGNGILHRDVKPENLFVTESGWFKLGDFGIAKALDRTVSTYSSKGTFSYMAPEVFRGETYDSRADLYSTGLILYKMLNHNRDPFIDPEKQIITHRDREDAMARRMKGEKLPPPAEADEALGRVILKACEYDPGNRYATADEMRQALEALSGSGSGQGKAETAGKGRRKILVAAAAVLALAAVCIILITGRNRTDDFRTAQETAAGTEEIGTEKTALPPEDGEMADETEETSAGTEKTGTEETAVPAEDGETSTGTEETAAGTEETAVPPEDGETAEIPAERIQAFGGVRFMLPEGFTLHIEEDGYASWITQDVPPAEILFMEAGDAQQNGGSGNAAGRPDPEIIQAGGCEITYWWAPENTNGIFVHASFRHGDGNRCYVYLGTNRENMLKYQAAFEQMLRSAE